MKVEIYADILCPWCYIGKRRLSAALAGLAEPPEIVWRSFELDPGASRTPGPTAEEAMHQWWGDRAPARNDLIRRTGAADGLELNLHLARPVNTFDAHRLWKLGQAHGKGEEMVERLLRAYHTEGRDLADPAVLDRVREEILPGVAFPDDAFAREVRDDEHRAAAQGVRGVPALVIDGREPVSGVQAPEAIRRLLTP
ncbi:DsbA family oxidoreductase [Nonomuraea typhae]|uniref:DsbA family oxidoreductase n=1 Tax=Nonomuraea typhae TaxID=2603600 RepID=UPI0012FB4DC9|nr:DsbA family oxidoreductase [Nonomuraea typhae]